MKDIVELVLEQTALVAAGLMRNGSAPEYAAKQAKFAMASILNVENLDFKLQEGDIVGNVTLKMFFK